MAVLKIQEIKRLRQIGHTLQPVVMIGAQGLSDNVVEEALRALNDHELIKVKVVAEDREMRKQIIEDLIERTSSHNVQQIGKIVLIYKKAAQQNPKLSNIVRFAHLSN